jgi:hypothetical protein
MTIGASSEILRGQDRLEIALVLDNTGSMVMNGSSKLATLKTEAKKLVDKLAVAAAQNTDPTAVKIALVPFSNTVRVQGSTVLTGANYDVTTHTGPSIPTWIDPQAKNHWASGRSDVFDVMYTDRLEMMKNISQPWAGCVEMRPQPYDVQEDEPSSDIDTKFVPYFWPDEPYTGSYKSSYNNYLPDGTLANGVTPSWMAYEKRSGKYTGTATSGTFNALGMTYSKGPNAGCTLQPVIRLTTDYAAIKTGIDNMNAIGETNIPIGLMWGWHAVTPKLPLGDGVAYGTPKTRKIVILMTDGENTNYDSGDSNNSYYSGIGWVWQKMTALTASLTPGERTAAFDGRLSVLCSNMKAKKIEIYTIRVEVTSGTSTLLQNCATTPDKFFDVQNVATLGVAFDAIASSITNLRIAR